MPIYSFYWKDSTARQELKSAGNNVAAAFQSLTQAETKFGAYAIRY